MDENKTPEDILNEIMNRVSAPEPEPEQGPDAKPPAPPRFEPPSLEAPSPAPAEKTAPPNWAGILLPWLCLVLGAALLVLGVCVLQVVKVNDRLDALEQAVSGVELVDQLQRDNEVLKRAQESMGDQLDQAEYRLREMERNSQEWSERYYRQQEKAEKLHCLWYAGHFMETGDYPMAALVMMYSIQYASGFQEDPALLDQYLAYHRELSEKGWLSAKNPDIDDTQVVSVLVNGRNPARDPDMAALGILWCCLEAYYVKGAPDMAVYYLVNYQSVPLGGGDEAAPFPQRVREFAQEDTAALYDRLVSALIEDGMLVEEDGVLDYAPDAAFLDVIYGLPFNPPFQVLYGGPYAPGELPGIGSGESNG